MRNVKRPLFFYQYGHWITIRIKRNNLTLKEVIASVHFFSEAKRRCAVPTTRQRESRPWRFQFSFKWALLHSLYLFYKIYTLPFWHRKGYQGSQQIKIHIIKPHCPHAVSSQPFRITNVVDLSTTQTEQIPHKLHFAPETAFQILLCFCQISVHTEPHFPTL